MPRQVLPEAQIHAAIRNKVANLHADIVQEVQTAVAHNAVVVVGLGMSPPGKKACSALSTSGVQYVYLEYGNYFNNWRRRNALKMWTGWPTFPMVFVKGTFVGGASDLQALIVSGELKTLLAA